MRPVYARRRVDSTAKELTAYARSLGLGVEPLGGTVDAVAIYGRVVKLIEWKSKGGELQPSQAKLVAKGVPLYFISTTEQVDALAAEMKAEALWKR